MLGARIKRDLRSHKPSALGPRPTHLSGCFKIASASFFWIFFNKEKLLFKKKRHATFFNKINFFFVVICFVVAIFGAFFYL